MAPLAEEIRADTPHQNIYTLSSYISRFRADAWVDMDLEGLAGEDRQMRREGERRIRCNVQCLNAEVGPKTVFMQQ